MKYWCGILLICWYFSSAFCFLQIRRSARTIVRSSDRGKPLVLTPYINQGKIKEALDAAEVKLDAFRDIKSYSGYFTVDHHYNSNLFFWFFPSKIDYENAPVVLWLQGGPGGSSLYGLFSENGPFIINDKGNIDLRKYTWIENHSVIYIDNPVGTGFSFTDGGYAQNETIVGEALYNALQQFFKLYPEFRKNDFYIAGESYAGKYVPAVAYTIHKNNPSALHRINLQGLAIGDGCVDPEHQLDYSDYLYQIGLIDSDAKLEMHKLQLETIKHIQNEQWLDALHLDETAFNLFKAAAGYSDIYNSLVPHDYNDEALNIFLNRPEVKTALHVGNITFYTINSDVYYYLSEDIMQSITPWVSTLLSHYRIMFYNGQLDICVAYPLTVNFLKHLKFSASDKYMVADRHQWYVNHKLAGYVKEAGNLTEVLVREAGHMVPKDQPLWALDMITKFTRNKRLY